MSKKNTSAAERAAQTFQECADMLVALHRRTRNLEQVVKAQQQQLQLAHNAMEYHQQIFSELCKLMGLKIEQQPVQPASLSTLN